MKYRKAGLYFIPVLLALFSFAERGFAVSWVKIGPDGGTALRFIQDPHAGGALYAETGSTRLAKTTDGGLQWKMIYDGPVPKWFRSLSVDSSDPAILYGTIFAGNKGAVKSVDGGIHWTALPAQPDFSPSTDTIDSLKVDPFHPNVLFATNEDIVCKSTDGGSTWRKIRTIWRPTEYHEAHYVFLEPDPANPDTIYLGGNGSDDMGSAGRVYWIEKSTDGGASWEVFVLPDNLRGLEFDPFDPARLYAVGAEGVFVSANGGQNWNRLSPSSLSEYTNCVTVAGAAGARFFYVGTNPGGLFRSADGGTTWTPVGGGLPRREITALHTDLNNPNVVWASAKEAGIFKSTDGGFTWDPFSSGFRGEMDFRALAVDPSRPGVLYAATSNDLFKSVNKGATWEWLGAGLQPTMSIHALAVHPDDPNTVYAGASNGIYKSGDGGRTWTLLRAWFASPYFYAGIVVIDPLHPETIYAGSRSGLLKSADGGSSWTDIGASLGVWDVLSLVLDPANPSIVYACMYNSGLAAGLSTVFKSTDGGTSWTNVPIDPSKSGYNRVWLAIDPFDSQTLYASTQYGIYKTGDAGGTWRLVFPSTLDKSYGPIAVDPKNPSTVYVLRDGLSKTEYIYRSLDGGEHWANYSEERGDNFWPSMIAIDPSDSEAVYFASFYSGTSVYAMRTAITGVPRIAVDRSVLRFGAAAGVSPTQTQRLRVSNAGEGVLNWTATPGPFWITVSPVAGSGDGTVQVSVNPGNQPPGTYAGNMTVDDPEAVNRSLEIQVILKIYGKTESGYPGFSAPPFGLIDTPADGANVSGSVPITGWALDDIQVANVRIFRDPVAGEASGLKFVGEAVFVEGARPDVETAYQNYPLNGRAGWGYMLLTNMLPNGGNGTFVLHAVATDAEGHAVEIGAKTIVVDNARAVKPFGAIDTPGQGGTAFGSNFVNFGWALTPLPNMIPIDGSTIMVWVDGQPVGRPIYNNYREDIAGLFPTLANADGAVGYFHLNTTAYPDGLHTIAWSVRDNAGNEEGIGSRFFDIRNASGSGGGASGAGETGAGKPLGAAGEATTTKMGAGPGKHILSELSARVEAGGLDSAKPLEAAGKGRPEKPIDPLGKQVVGAGGESADRKGREMTPVGPGSRAPVWIRRGFRADAAPEPVYPDNAGRIRIEMPEVGRLELELDGPETRGLNWMGALVVDGKFRPLPIGSRLDAARGIFYWQPGPGFVGTYEFVFSKATGPAVRIRVVIG